MQDGAAFKHHYNSELAKPFPIFLVKPNLCETRFHSLFRRKSITANTEESLASFYGTAG
jgi:hypothetical protein